MVSQADAAALHKAQEGIRALVRRDLTAFWSRLDLADPEAARDALIGYVPQVVKSYGEIAATFAADWYDSVRPSSGSFRAEMVTTDNAAAIEQTIRRAVGGLFGDNPDPETVLNAIVERSGRYTLEDARQTITEAARADPASNGWSRVAQEGACSFCQSLALDFNYEANFEAHDGCVPDGTAVWGPEILAATRRRYAGEMTIITTASGQKMTVTPNHPVLTDKGWVPAGLVREGDSVVGHSGSHRVVAGGPREQQAPSLIEDVWRAASVRFGFRTVPISSENFHGDGSEGEVDVVFTDRYLASVGASALYEPPREMGLRLGHGLGMTLARECSSAEWRDGRGLPSDGGVGRSGDRLPLLGGHAGIANQRCLGHGSALDAVLSEQPLNDGTRDAVLLGERIFGFPADVPSGNLDSRQVIPDMPVARFDPADVKFVGEGVSTYSRLGRSLLNRLAGEVELDRVVFVERVDSSSTHVYNLHTSEGWYSADKYIVSNCNCIAVPNF